MEREVSAEIHRYQSAGGKAGLCQAVKLARVEQRQLPLKRAGDIHDDEVHRLLAAAEKVLSVVQNEAPPVAGQGRPRQPAHSRRGDDGINFHAHDMPGAGAQGLPRRAERAAADDHGLRLFKQGRRKSGDEVVEVGKRFCAVMPVSIQKNVAVALPVFEDFQPLIRGIGAIDRLAEVIAPRPIEVKHPGGFQAVEEKGIETAKGHACAEYGPASKQKVENQNKDALVQQHESSDGKRGKTPDGRHSGEGSKHLGAIKARKRRISGSGRFLAPLQQKGKQGAVEKTQPERPKEERRNQRRGIMIASQKETRDPAKGKRQGQMGSPLGQNEPPETARTQPAGGKIAGG